MHMHVCVFVYMYRYARALVGSWHQEFFILIFMSVFMLVGVLHCVAAPIAWFAGVTTFISSTHVKLSNNLLCEIKIHKMKLQR